MAGNPNWKPGVSGNPAGPRKQKPWREALDRALTKLDEGKPLGTTMALIAEKCAQDALNGDKDARREIAERYDGKVPQAVVGGGEGSEPIQINVRTWRDRLTSTSITDLEPNSSPSTTEPKDGQ